MAAVQRPRARAGGGFAHAAAGAPEVLRDRLLEPRRVLHGPRGGPARPDRRRHRDAAAGRAHAERDDRADPRHRARPRRPPGARARAGAAPRAGRARHPDRRRGGGRRGRAHGARRALPAPDLPRPDAAGGRPRAPVPLHLQPLALARRRRARPGRRGGGLRAREGPEGDAAALRPGRRRAHVRAARGPDRQEPRRALPGHGDRRPRGLPRHARRRLHGLRRGRRPRARGRGRAAPPPLRRGRAGRGLRLDERHDARADHRDRWPPRRRTSSRSPACSTWRTCGTS